MYLDIATVKLLDSDVKVVNPNWHIMVDEWTQMKFSDFFQTKNTMVEPTCEKFMRWKQDGFPVKKCQIG